MKKRTGGRWRGVPRALRGAAVVVVLGVGVAGCRGADASPGVIELKLGHASSPGSLVAVTAEEFVRRVNEELAGQVHISLFGSGQLGGDEVLTIKLRLGTVDFALPSTTLSSTIEPFGFFEVPYLIRDRDHLALIEERIFWPYIAPYADEMDFGILALWEHGFRQITNNARPIVHPSDLAGIKLRVPSGFWRIAAFQAFGANPTPMPLTEVFVALQTGVLDGQENPLPQIYASRFQEVQRYLSLSNHVYSPVFVTVGARKWATHPPEVRAAIERIAREVQEFSRAEGERMDVAIRQEIGVSVAINEVDRDAFIAASQPIYEHFGSIVPEGLQWIEMALALEDELDASATVIPPASTSAPLDGDQ